MADNFERLEDKATKLLSQLQGHFTEFRRLQQVDGYLCYNPANNTLGAHIFETEGEAFQLNLETEEIEINDKRIFGCIQSFVNFTNPSGYNMKITEQSFKRFER